MTSIGILGGVGAIASARFHLDLVTRWASTHGARTDDDFPRIVHLSRSLGLSAAGLTDAVDQGDILSALTEPAFDGLDRIAIVCNSITSLCPSEREWPGILTPVAACREALRGVSRAALLASESTIRDEIYQRAYPEIEWRMVPATHWIEHSIGGGGFNIGGVGHHPDETIVLGCTELSTQMRTRFTGCPTVISPTDEMVRLLCLT